MVPVEFGVDRDCLEKGLNMHVPASLPIMSRVGVKSEDSPSCSMLHFMRGVGIGSRQEPKMSCGEIIISDNKHLLKSFPANCRIYIQ